MPIDRNFLQYGVQSADMEIIEQSCRECGIDCEWLRENILRPYNNQRNDKNVVEPKEIAKILKKALRKIPS